MGSYNAITEAKKAIRAVNGRPRAGERVESRHGPLDHPSPPV